VTSGIRLGTPAATTRGFGPAEWRDVGDWIGEVLEGLVANPDDNSTIESAVQEKVLDLCRRFPIYPDAK
jgi:glycine hydroxymethyltransferase